MIDVGTMIKALRLAWFPRLFPPGRKNWKTVPVYYLGRYAGLTFFQDVTTTQNILTVCHHFVKHFNCENPV